MIWLSRNFMLLIGGLILLPISLLFLLMGLALGVGFSNDPAMESLKLVLLVGSYAIVYFLSVYMSLRRFKLHSSYGYWEMLPIHYFAVLLVSMFVVGRI